MTPKLRDLFKVSETQVTVRRQPTTKSHRDTIHKLEGIHVYPFLGLECNLDNSRGYPRNVTD